MGSTSDPRTASPPDPDQAVAALDYHPAAALFPLMEFAGAPGYWARSSSRLRSQTMTSAWPAAAVGRR